MRAQMPFLIIKYEVSVGSGFLICEQEYLLSCLHRLTEFLVRKRSSQVSLETVVCAASSVLVSLDAREVLERPFFSVGLPFLSRTCLFRAAHLVCLLSSKGGKCLMYGVLKGRCRKPFST